MCFRHQCLGRFRLGEDCPVDLLLGAVKIDSRNGETGVGQQWIDSVRRHLFGFGEGFLSVFRSFQAHLGITARDQDRGIQQRILAIGFQLLQHLVEFVLREHGPR